MLLTASGRSLRSTLLDLHQDLGETASTVEQRRLDFDRQIARFDYDHTLCDGLHYVCEAWSTMTVALSAAKSLAQRVSQVASEFGAEQAGDMARDHALDAAADRVGDAATRVDDLAVTDLTRDQMLDLGKSAATQSIDLWQSAESALSGLMGAGLDEVFGLACEEYVGDFTAQMGADVYQGSSIYWQYQTHLKGKMRVRFEKRSAGGSKGGVAAPLPVTGEFEGVADKFAVQESLYLLQPGIEKDTLFRWVIPPVGGLFLEDAGFFRPLTPYSFYVPFHGVLEGDTLKLHIEEATSDFEASATAVYVLVNPAIPFPHVMTQDLPYQGGGFIVSRALENEPEFQVQVHADQHFAEIKKAFKRKADTPDGAAKVNWSAEVRICNPRCP